MIKWRITRQKIVSTEALPPLPPSETVDDALQRVAEMAAADEKAGVLTRYTVTSGRLVAFDGVRMNHQIGRYDDWD